MGIAIGSVVHSQVAALVGTLVWIFVVENLLVGLLGLLDGEGVTAYLPFRVLDAADGTGGDNLISYWPAVAASRPRISRMVVDLPAPLGPRNPVTRPGCTVKERRSTARVPS